MIQYILDGLEFYRSGSTSPIDVTKPIGWKLRFDCEHIKEMSNEAIERNLVSRSNYNVDTGGSELKLICPGRKNNERGSCEKSVIHRVEDMTPLFQRQIHDNGYRLASENKKEEVQEVSPAKAAADNYINDRMSGKLTAQETKMWNYIKRERPQLFARIWSNPDWRKSMPLEDAQEFGRFRDEIRQKLNDYGNGHENK